MSDESQAEALLWLAFAIGDLEIVPTTAIQSATAVRQAIAVVRIIREDFERRGISTEGLEPR